MNSRKKLLNSYLICIALAVWGWNARLLTVLPEQEKDITATPELSKSWEHVLQTQELPEMKFDPFNPFGKVDVNAIQNNRRPTNQDNLPRGTFILILEREEFFEAVFKESSGKTRNLKENGRINRWIVDEIQLDMVRIKHQTTGKIHEYKMP